MGIQETLTGLYGDDLLFMDGYDAALCGVVHRIGQEPIVCYDREKVIELNMSRGMTYEEAETFFEYNQLGAWVGERTPCFLEKEF